MPIQITAEFLQALELIEETDHHVFVTGKAGTGKSTLLNYFRETTKKNIAVLAPTGVAALNVGGQTIHSFFKFRPDVTIESAARSKPAAEVTKIIRKLDTIVIDEASMLRADLLDCIDVFLRKHGPDRHQPFGGVQMIFFGDLFQLPPVVTSFDREKFNQLYEGPYFFNAKVMSQIGLHLIELTEVFRQEQGEFLDILNAVRSGTLSQAHIDVLNTRANQLFSDSEPAITITSTNALADSVNQRRLAALQGDAFSWAAKKTGNFGEREAPSPAELTLKTGAQVMMLTNDSRGRWVNGSLGTVTAVYDEPGNDAPTIDVKLTNGTTISVSPFTWELFSYRFDDDTQSLEPEVTGTFRQYPLRLAWAVTIHKSQGKTFDNVTIDVGSGTFSPGQLYVALSRCRSLDGITLTRPVSSKHLFAYPAISTFLDSFREGYRMVGQGTLDFSEWGS